MGGEMESLLIGKAFDENWGLADQTRTTDEEFKRVIALIEGNVKRLILEQSSV